MKYVYIVNIEDDYSRIFKTEIEAIRFIENITGVNHKEWPCDNGITDKYGFNYYITEGIIED